MQIVHNGHSTGRSHSALFDSNAAPKSVSKAMIASGASSSYLPVGLGRALCSAFFFAIPARSASELSPAQGFARIGWCVMPVSFSIIYNERA